MCATTSAGFRVQRVHRRFTVQWVTGIGCWASASPVQGAYTLADDVKALIRQVYARRGSLKIQVFHCLVALQRIFYMHCRPILYLIITVFISVFFDLVDPFWTLLEVQLSGTSSFFATFLATVTGKRLAPANCHVEVAL